MKLRWLPDARDDVRGIMGYISLANRPAAVAWSGRIHHAARRAAELPLSGRKVPEVGLDDVREIIVGNHRLIYRVATDEVQILAVIDGRRLLPTDLGADPAE